MILFTFLLITLALLTFIVVGTVSALGAGVIVIFGDVIVCAVFIILIMRFIIKRKKNKK